MAQAREEGLANLVDSDDQASSKRCCGKKKKSMSSSFHAVAVGSFIGEQPGAAAQPGTRLCGCLWSGNMKVLLATAILFTVITVSQYFAAVIANSNALIADCVSMAVDAFSYLLAIPVELLEGTRVHRPLQVVVPLISIGALTYFTITVIIDAIPGLQPGPDDDDDVNPWIVLAFAVWGLFFDCVSLFLFWKNAKNQEDGSDFGTNMLAALMHVGADFARSTTTFVESILIIGFKFNGVVCDSWACLIVSTTILFGVLFALWEWASDLIRGPEKKPSRRPTEGNSLQAN